MITKEQWEKLADLFLDLSKASFIGAFAIPILNNANAFFFIRGLIFGIVCIILCLWTVYIKEKR